MHLKGPLILIVFFCFLKSGYPQENFVDDNSNLIQYALFGSIKIGIPENVPRHKKKMDKGEEMGFATFSTKDKKVEIKIRKMEETDLSMTKDLIDEMSKSVYNGTILRSDLIKINNIDIFVTDIKGQWNGNGEIIGMFRYYFNVNGNSYNLLMRYPADLIERTNNLKEKMLQSIDISQ